MKVWFLSRICGSLGVGIPFCELEELDSGVCDALYDYKNRPKRFKTLQAIAQAVGITISHLSDLATQCGVLQAKVKTIKDAHAPLTSNLSWMACTYSETLYLNCY